jgi:3-oxo-5-alpha-steroid 4-dehydrogenase 3
MWIGHYLMGLGFYLAANLAAGVEMGQHAASHSRLDYWTVAFICLWMLATVQQARLHSYFRHLPKGVYSSPKFPAFAGLHVLTPHYFFEIMIYVSMAGVAGNNGFNKTMSCVAVFVAVNLGVTAAGTWEWYWVTFGEDAVRGKSRMIPYLW